MIFFDEYGNKKNPTLLMLHGAGALDTFCRQYCFSEKYHLVVPHLGGAGKAAGEAYEPERAKRALWALIESLHKTKIGVVGHSLGGQLAVRLVSERPDLFSFAVFLSAWVNPKPATVERYCRFSGIASRMLHLKGLVRLQGNYWNYTREQADALVASSQKITPHIYESFFVHTLDVSKLPSYRSVRVPMFAMCGSRETKDMKTSLQLLAENPSCQARVLPKANHDFPMRNARELNAVLEKIFAEYA